MMKNISLSFLLFMLFSAQNTMAGACQSSLGGSSKDIINTTRLILSQKNISMEDYEQITHSAVMIAVNTGDRRKGYEILNILLKKDDLPEGVSAKAVKAMEHIESLKPHFHHPDRFNNPYRRGGITV